MAPDGSGIQVLPLLPLHPSVHRGRASAAGSRCNGARRRVGRPPCARGGKRDHLRALEREARGRVGPRHALEPAVGVRQSDGARAGGPCHVRRAAERACPAFATRTAWRPLQGAAFPQRFEAEAECRLASGEIRRVRVDDALGNTSRPPGQDAVLTKFRANASLAMSGDGVGALAAQVMALDKVDDLAELGRLLRSGSPVLLVRSSSAATCYC